MPSIRPSKHLEMICEEIGSELVEFALAASVLLTMIFGIMGFSLALYSYHYCAQMAREATRYAAVRGATWAGTACATPNTYACAATSSDVSNFVVSITPLGLSTANLNVTTTWPSTKASGSTCTAPSVYNSPGCVVKVKVAYAFSYTMPFLPQTPLALSSTSSLTIAQ